MNLPFPNAFTINSVRRRGASKRFPLAAGVAVGGQDGRLHLSLVPMRLQDLLPVMMSPEDCAVLILGVDHHEKDADGRPLSLGAVCASWGIAPLLDVGHEVVLDPESALELIADLAHYNLTAIGLAERPTLDETLALIEAASSGIEQLPLGTRWAIAMHDDVYVSAWHHSQVTIAEAVAANVAILAGTVRRLRGVAFPRVEVPSVEFVTLHLLDESAFQIPWEALIVEPRGGSVTLPVCKPVVPEPSGLELEGWRTWGTISYDERGSWSHVAEPNPDAAGPTTFT